MDDKARMVSIKVSIYANWNDSRIVRKNTDNHVNVNLASGKDVSKFFRPDFYVYNLLNFQGSFFEDQPSRFIMLTPEGNRISKESTMIDKLKSNE